MRKSHRTCLCVIAGAFLALAATTARAGERFEDSSAGRRIALGLGAGATSLVYTPAKLCYAAGATLAGGLVFACTVGTEPNAATRLVQRGVGGDWYVHPDVLTGHRKLQFSGEI